MYRNNSLFAFYPFFAKITTKENAKRENQAD
jgi:hypothetical protein